MRRIAHLAAVVPWSRGRRQEDPLLNSTNGHTEEEQVRRPLLKLTAPSSEQQTGPQPLSQSYGSTGRLTSSPERHRSNSYLNRVPEEGQELVEEAVEAEEAEEVEWELEEQGLYGGSYRRVVIMYTFVPLSSLLVFVLLAFQPALIWPIRNSRPLPHPQYFPYPLPELLVSSALWSLSHLLRVPLYTVTSFLLRRSSPLLVTFLFNAVFVIVYNVLRLSALPILRIKHQMDYPMPTPHDLAFRRVWWLGLGWAAIETIVGIVQDYSQIALYKNVMVPEERIAEVMVKPGSGGGSRQYASPQEEILALSPRADGPSDTPAAIRRVESNASSPPRLSTTRALGEALELEVDRDIEQLVNLKEREELEEIYGMPIIRIPVFVSCLQRIDSIIITLGITLILSASYLRSNISLSTSLLSPSLSSNKPFFITFPLVVLLNLFLSLLYSPLILPRIGIHTTAYIGFLVGLGTLFTGLGLWGALS